MTPEKRGVGLRMPACSELLFVSLHRVVAGKTVMPMIEREQIAVGRLHRSLGIVFDSPFAEHESQERMVAPGGGVEEERVEMIYQKAGLTGLHHIVAEEQTLLGGHPTGKALGDENLEGEVAHLGFVYFVEQLLGELSPAAMYSSKRRSFSFIKKANAGRRSSLRRGS